MVTGRVRYRTRRLRTLAHINTHWLGEEMPLAWDEEMPSQVCIMSSAIL